MMRLPSVSPLLHFSILIGFILSFPLHGSAAQTEVTTTILDRTKVDQEKPVEQVKSKVQVEDQTAKEGTEGTITTTGEESLEDLLSLVSDNSFHTHKREMAAYWRLIEKANKQPFDRLIEDARANPRFNDFYTAPSKHRGELVKLVLNVRRVIPYSLEFENRAGVREVFEMWGVTDESKAWVYCCVTSELPPGFPREGDVSEKVTLVGYFFKLQAYQPGDAAPNAKALVAPLILGRIDWKSDAKVLAAKGPNWPLYLIAGFGVIIAMRVMMQVRSMNKPMPARSMYRRRSLEPIDAEALSIALRGDSKEG